MRDAMKDESKYRFSKSASRILERAVRLASESGRDRITSSCILFAFGESEGEQVAHSTHTLASTISA